MLDISWVSSELDLERALSEPYPEDIEAAKDLGGDLIVLGAGGKMGPTLVRRALTSIQRAGSKSRVLAVSRFADDSVAEHLEHLGALVIRADLLSAGVIEGLPLCPNVIFMAGMKFGSSGNQPLTWAMNSYLPGRIAEHFRRSRIVAFSTGNVYSLVQPKSGGSLESDPPGPVGEYAQSCLGRERILQYFSESNSTPVAILRLNYAVEARYGVLIDLAQKIRRGEPVPLSMGYVNVIWQGDANSVCLRSFSLCSSPACLLNLTGVEVLSVRELALELGRRMGIQPRFSGEPGDSALLNNASRCRELFGAPRVTTGQLLDLAARWVSAGGANLGRPTKFEIRDGKF